MNNNLFIREGYFQLYEPKHMAKFPYALDILVISDTIQIQQIPLETKNYFLLRVSKRKIQEIHCENWEIRDRILFFTVMLIYFCLMGFFLLSFELCDKFQLIFKIHHLNPNASSWGIVHFSCYSCVSVAQQDNLNNRIQADINRIQYSLALNIV